MALPHSLRKPESIPSEPLLRRRVIADLVAEIQERRLAGPRLHQYAWTIRAQLGTDVAVGVLLALLDRRPAD